MVAESSTSAVPPAPPPVCSPPGAGTSGEGVGESDGLRLCVRLWEGEAAAAAEEGGVGDGVLEGVEAGVALWLAATQAREDAGEPAPSDADVTPQEEDTVPSASMLAASCGAVARARDVRRAAARDGRAGGAGSSGSGRAASRGTETLRSAASTVVVRESLNGNALNASRGAAERHRSASHAKAAPAADDCPCETTSDARTAAAPPQSTCESPAAACTTGRVKRPARPTKNRGNSAMRLAFFRGGWEGGGG